MRGTEPLGQVGLAVVHVMSPAQLPCVQVPLGTSQNWPPAWLQSVSAVQPGGFGSHDERSVLQWKPVPQSASVAQKPASSHVPFSQKQPAAQSVLEVHS